MGKKYQNINRLYEQGINVHSFKLLETKEDLIEYANENPVFSIRFDRDTNYHQLPFYVYEEHAFTNDQEKFNFFEKIAYKAKEMGCMMLCSDGHKYDDIQLCNFVISLNEQQDFLLEWSTKKVPLRNMYQFSTSTLKGNMKDSFKDMEWTLKGENVLDDTYLEKILLWAFSLNIYNCEIEGTLYPMKVGLKKEEIVCWQTD